MTEKQTDLFEPRTVSDCRARIDFIAGNAPYLSWVGFEDLARPVFTIPLEQGYLTQEEAQELWQHMKDWSECIRVTDAERYNA